MPEKVLFSMKKTELKKALSLVLLLAKKYKTQIIAFAAVFIFGIVPLGNGYPFGFALYIAMDSYIGLGFGALCLSTVVGDGPLMGISVAIGLFAYKKLWEGSRQKPYAKPLVALTAMSFIWVSGIGNGAYTMAQSASWLVITPLFTMLYSFALDSECKKIMRHGGFSAMVFTVMLFVGRLSPFLWFSYGMTLLIAFSAAVKGGMLYGGLYGFLAGLSLGTGGAAIGGVTAFVCGLFSVVSEKCALLCGTVAGFCTGFYFFGLKNGFSLFFSFVAAGIAYFALKDKLVLLPFETIPVNPHVKERSDSGFAEAFFAISQTARKNAPHESEAIRAADQYAGISTLLTAAEEKRITEEHTDEALSSKAAALLFGAGVRAESIKVTGGRKKLLIAENVEVDRLALSSAELKQLMSVALGCTMKEPVFQPCSEGVRLVMESAPRFRIECSRNGCPKKGEEISGDTVSFFSGEGGYFYALISDGMGSGKAAAECSRLAGMFLEKLLSAGADRRAALSLLNGFLASRKEEVFATVDLFEADLYTGKGVLVKAGAAPSFIMRGDDCRRLESATAPAGIIRDIKAEQLSFELMDGDTLIMLSDGISGEGSCEETEALLKKLKEERSTAVLADTLLAHGARSTGNKDDMSVCVIKVIAA